MSDGLADLYLLGRQLGDVPAHALPFTRKAMEFTSRSVKDAWNGRLYNDGAAKLTGHAITYDIDEADGGFESDIGAVRGSGRQAGVVLLLEYGSKNNGAHGGGAASLDENEDDFESGLDKALEDAERAAGL